MGVGVFPHKRRNAFTSRKIQVMQEPNKILKHRNLPLLLLQAREEVFSRFRPLLNDAGVTEQQWRVVRALLEHGPMEPRQIGDICCLSSPSLAGILARMDELGLVLRERFPNDQRRVLVSASTKGVDLAAELAPRIESTYKELEAIIGQTFARDLYQTLDLLLQKLDSSESIAE
jgi:homoprotocatechuate degradation regulator HpaR